MSYIGFFPVLPLLLPLLTLVSLRSFRSAPSFPIQTSLIRVQQISTYETAAILILPSGPAPQGLSIYIASNAYPLDD